MTNQRRALWAVVALAAIALTATLWRENSRSKPPDLPFAYSFVRESTSWNPEVWVNGQPALRFEGNFSGLYEITPFVVDGENEVRVKAARNLEDAFGPDDRGECSLRLMRAKARLTDLTELCAMTEPRGSDKDELTFEFKFTAEIPLRWRWQDADDVGELTQADRESMLGLFHQFVDAHKALDADAICSLVTPWYPGSSPPSLSGEFPPQGRKAVTESNVAILKDCELIVTPDEEIHFIAGTKTVMMFRPGTEARFAGPAPRSLIAVNRVVEVGTNQPPGSKLEKHVEAVFDALYFIRRDGSWHLVGLDWQL